MQYILKLIFLYMENKLDKDKNKGVEHENRIKDAFSTYVIF